MVIGQYPGENNDLYYNNNKLSRLNSKYLFEIIKKTFKDCIFYLPIYGKMFVT